MPTNSNASHWRDGRFFAPRVQVWSYDQSRLLFVAPAGQARQYCLSGVADTCHSGRRIWRIFLLRVLPKPSPLVPQPYPLQHFSQRFTYLEVLGYSPLKGRLTTYQFRHLDRRDPWPLQNEGAVVV